MKVKAIDIVMKAIETAADEAAWVIDDNPAYCKVCEIVTLFDEFGIEPTFEQKQFCAETLETMCRLLDINYLRLLTEALAEEEG